MLSHNTRDMKATAGDNGGRAETARFAAAPSGLLGLLGQACLPRYLQRGLWCDKPPQLSKSPSEPVLTPDLREYKPFVLSLWNPDRKARFDGERDRREVLIGGPKQLGSEYVVTCREADVPLTSQDDCHSLVVAIIEVTKLGSGSPFHYEVWGTSHGPVRQNPSWVAYPWVGDLLAAEAGRLGISEWDMLNTRVLVKSLDSFSENPNISESNLLVSGWNPSNLWRAEVLRRLQTKGDCIPRVEMDNQEVFRTLDAPQT